MTVFSTPGTSYLGNAKSTQQKILRACIKIIFSFSNSVKLCQTTTARAIERYPRRKKSRWKFSASGFGNNGRRVQNKSIIIRTEIVAKNCYGSDVLDIDPASLTLRGACICFWFGAGNHQCRDSSVGGGGSDYILSAKRYHPFAYGVLISPYGLPIAAFWLSGKVQDLKFAIQGRVYY